MKKLFFLLTSLVIFNQWAMAQSITLTPNTPASPTKGTMVFDNVTNQLKYWNGSAWVSLIGGGGGGASYWELNGVGGDVIKNTNSGGFWSANPTGLASFADNASNPPTAPVSGPGTRLMWIPSRSAFRVGTLTVQSGGNDGTQWDAPNIGLFSFASGFNTKANGKYSTALGYFTTASGNYSTAMGYATTASGDASTAMGSSTTASGSSSTAMGFYTIASGNSSTAMGNFTTASGNSSTAMGNSTIASGNSSTAMGSYNVDVPDALLMVGNGTGSRSNALTILRNITNPNDIGNNISKVGINTTNPIVPLHIEGATLSAEMNYHYFNWGSTNQIKNLPNNTSYISLLAGGDIVTRGTIASSQSVTTSDARIKTILGVSDNQQDLETLRKLKITDYRYKDVVNWGSQTFKKVIAQQVEEVYPQAVRKQTSTLPDVYCLAEKVVYDESRKELTVTLSKDYGIKVGSKIDLIHAQKGRMQAEVISVSGHSFTVKDWLYTTDKIFVYGREVNDFRVVDYEALSMLGISATQALLQRLEQAEKESQTLQKDLRELRKSTDERFEKLEVLLQKEKHTHN